VVSGSALVQYSGFYNDLVAQARAAMTTGKTAQEAAAAYAVPARYSELKAPPQSVRTIRTSLYEGR